MRSLSDNSTACAFFDAVFDGHRLTTLTIRGVPYWIAREVGEVLDYGKSGRQLVTSITKNWKSEMQPSIHTFVLDGDDLAAVKTILDSTANRGQVLDGRVPSLLLLTREGLNRVLILTGKPIGVRFRDWLDSTVLPAVQDTGTYSVAEAPTPKAIEEKPEPTPKAMSRARALIRTGYGLLKSGDRPSAHRCFGEAAEIMAAKPFPTLARGVDPEYPQIPIPPVAAIAEAPKAIEPPDPWADRLLAFMATQTDPICYRDIARILFDTKHRDLAANRRIRAILTGSGYSYGVFRVEHGKDAGGQRRGWVKRPTG